MSARERERERERETERDRESESERQREMHGQCVRERKRQRARARERERPSRREREKERGKCRVRGHHLEGEQALGQLEARPFMLLRRLLHPLPQAHQTAFSIPLICTGARRNPVTCGANQGGRKRRFDFKLFPSCSSGASSIPSHQAADSNQITLFKSLIRDGARHNPASCGSQQRIQRSRVGSTLRLFPQYSFRSSRISCHNKHTHSLTLSHTLASTLSLSLSPSATRPQTLIRIKLSFSIPLMFTGARRSEATCGATQGSQKRRS